MKNGRPILMPKQNFLSYREEDVLNGEHDRDRDAWAKKMWFVHSFTVLDKLLVVLYEKFEPPV